MIQRIIVLISAVFFLVSCLGGKQEDVRGISSSGGGSVTSEGDEVGFEVTSMQAMSYNASAQPAVVTWRHKAELIADEKTECGIAKSEIREKSGPYITQLKILNGEDRVFYVDGSKETGGTGSRESPFAKISEAVDFAKSPQGAALLIIAAGNYEETELRLPPALHLLGGFNPQDWSRDDEKFVTALRLSKGALLVTGVTGKDVKTVIDGMTIYGPPTDKAAIQLLAESHLLLRDSIVYQNMQVVTWPTYGDTHHGKAIEGDKAILEAYHNRFLVPSEAPEHVISNGVILHNGCLILAKNHFVSYRTSLNSYSNKGIVFQNVVEDGYNGLSSHNEGLAFVENTIGLEAHAGGCGYAIYLEEATAATIVKNYILLEGGSAKGINEAGVESDAIVLRNNHFVLLEKLPPQMGVHMLYGDADGDHSSGRANRIISNIDEVNALNDIPDVGGNTVESATTEGLPVTW